MVSLSRLLGRRPGRAPKDDEGKGSRGPGLSGWRSGLAVAALVAGMAGGYVNSAYAAVSAPVASGLTRPNGVLWMSGAMGGHAWVSDEAQGFCRMDAVPGTATLAINPATCAGVAVDPGEAAYDPATGSVYLPDQDGASQGVWRLKFDPAMETVGSAVLLAPDRKLGGMSPNAVALGPDGKLYVSLRNKTDLLRIANPSGALQTVESVGRVAGDRVVRSMAFLGQDLYLADGNALSKFSNAGLCTGGCKPTVVGSVALEPAALASEGASLYIGGIASISRLSAATGGQDLYASGFANIRGLGQDGVGGLYVVQDPAEDLPVSQGAMLKVVPGL